MIRSSILCLLTLFASLPGRAADTVPAPESASERNVTLTFETALTLADGVNPELAVANRQIEIAAGTELQARARPNPDLSFTGDWLGQPQPKRWRRSKRFTP